MRREVAGALLALVFIAVMQFVLVTRLANARLPTSGQVGMRAETIAFLAAGVRSGRPEPGWRTELAASLAAMNADLQASVLAPAGSAAQRYRAAALALRNNRLDEAALRDLERDAPQIEGAETFAAQRRTHANARALRATIALWCGGIALQAAILAGVWLQLMRRARRRLADARTDLRLVRGQSQSIFDGNPDAVCFYDRLGRRVRSNHAWQQMWGADARGSEPDSFVSAITPERRVAAAQAFARALQGETISWNDGLCNAAGEAIDVQTSIFPVLRDGVCSGVIAVARGVRELRRAQAQSALMSSRLAGLCEIASAQVDDWREQIVAALALAAFALRFDWGLVGEVAGDELVISGAIGEPPGISTGTRLPLEGILGRHLVADEQVCAVDDTADCSWHSVWSAKLRVHSGVGVFALGNALPGGPPLSAADRDFIKIAGALVGAIIDRAHHEKKLDTLAFSDTLTGLPNRLFISDVLDDYIARAIRTDGCFALHFLDLDHFKTVNDRAGHAIGDEALREMANRFARCVRATDVVARLGGDEFIVLQPMGAGRSGAALLAQRLSSVAAQPFIHGGVAYHLGCSIGISLFPQDARDATTLLALADEAMYRAKAARDNIAVFAQTTAGLGTSATGISVVGKCG